MNLFRIAPKIESDLIFGHVRARLRARVFTVLIVIHSLVGLFALCTMVTSRDLQRCGGKWSCTCSDTALAAVCGTTDSEVRRLKSTQSNVFHWVRSVSLQHLFGVILTEVQRTTGRAGAAAFSTPVDPELLQVGGAMSAWTLALRLSLSVFVPPSLVLL